MNKNRFTLFEELQEGAGGGGVATAPPPAAPAGPDVVGTLNHLDQKLNAIASRLAANQQQPAAPNVNVEDAKKQFLNKFFEDPLTTVGTISGAVAQQAVREAQQQQQLPVETLVANAQQMCRESLTEENRGLWDRYVNDIRMKGLSANAPPQILMNHNYWQNVFRVVVGEKISEIREEMQRAAGEQNRAPAAHIKNGGPMQGTPPSHSPKPSSARLTEEELRVAKGFGLSADEYFEGKRLLEGQSVRGDSSWDEFVTFDSEKKRRQSRNKEKK